MQVKEVLDVEVRKNGLEEEVTEFLVDRSLKGQVQVLVVHGRNLGVEEFLVDQSVKGEVQVLVVHGRKLGVEEFLVDWFVVQVRR